jgi:hypothetical protein
MKFSNDMLLDDLDINPEFLQERKSKEYQKEHVFHSRKDASKSKDRKLDYNAQRELKRNFN